MYFLLPFYSPFACFDNRYTPIAIYRHYIQLCKIATSNSGSCFPGLTAMLWSQSDAYWDGVTSTTWTCCTCTSCKALTKLKWEAQKCISVMQQIWCSVRWVLSLEKSGCFCGELWLCEHHLQLAWILMWEKFVVCRHFNVKGIFFPEISKSVR